MITIDSLIGQMKSLFAIKTPVRFDTPEYIQFYNDLIQYIYENHFEESDEWKIISRNLVYTSTQRMATGEGNTILIQLIILEMNEFICRGHVIFGNQYWEDNFQDVQSIRNT